VTAEPTEVFLPENLTLCLKEKTTVAATAAGPDGETVPTTFKYSASQGTGKITVNPKTGKRVSVNAVQYYAWKRQQEELEAEKYARDFFMKFMREECPQLVEALNVFGNIGSYMY
jgi:hypothetical protein